MQKNVLFSNVQILKSCPGASWCSAAWPC